MRRILAVVVALAALATSVAVALAASPSVSTGAPTGVGDTTATFTGTVNPEGTGTQYRFQYGTAVVNGSPVYGQETPLVDAGSGTADEPVTANVTGLTPGTPYHYRIVAVQPAVGGGTATGNDVTFSTTGTAPAPAPKPVVTTGPSSNVGVNTATVSGTVNPSGSPTTWYFEFGPTTAYGYQTTPQSGGSGTTAFPVTGSLVNLQSNTTYHYRLVATSLNGTTVGTDASFKTGTPAPTTSRLALFGRTGFVSPSGVAGVLAGCLGQTMCAHDSLTVTRNGQTLGQRVSSVFIAAQDGGVIHVSLNTTGRALVRRFGHLHVTMTLTSPSGQTVSGGYTLVQFK